MNTTLEKIRGFRHFLLQQVEGLTTAQLNDIPLHHNNSIAWNLAHLTAAQQTMTYVRSGLPITLDDKYFSPYVSGTKPQAIVLEQDIINIKALMISSLDTLQADLDKNRFANYSPSIAIPKVYGFEVTNIHEALDYLLYHEGLHAGSILALKRAL